MKKGMNPEAVEQLATSVQDATDQATQLYNTARDALEGLDWTGEDRDRYVSEFEDLGSQVQDLVRQGTELAQRLTTNAQQQRQASA
ncbi:WXG100 family type VII secretion target [Brachybacterium nesterenkovii]|uniref:WXG100 family type VII secretion target n=1 Tax=Brachybacterium nesterenkovii TaxID=47847 RepID=A0A1X6X836_9MICO|nr:WXG100 family type VII secretion target [Brachybacterium nesterenkovii]SLM95494.1 hypothetical protein FM110_12890 [Brachybacterium nesterenkovii]